jgi:hypothetical protein
MAKEIKEAVKARYENVKREQGHWDPIFSAVIP